MRQAALAPPNNRIFGLRIAPWTASQVAAHVLEIPRSLQSGVGLVVTPNIQHVALLETDPAFRSAYRSAEITVCDGFPVHYYARARGCPSPGRVTGCDIVADIMAQGDALARHRLFFLLDHEETARALQAWAARHGLDRRVAALIPPFGFEHDPAFCRTMAENIRDHGTTLLFLGVGAPKSEVFVARHRELLPPCWALCTGQAVKLALGLAPRPPRLVQALNLEWLWRTALEPRRLGKRYAHSVPGFLRAILRDLRTPQPDL
jgi:N-acetylglucosaminyldiphosphoundecaprenol N-acetyl-beta-D-mannosaminyltransferase